MLLVQPPGVLGEDPAATRPLSVAVSILPQKYFVERIGGRYVDVVVMVGPGDSPAVYEPVPSQLKALRDAAVYFALGVPFEQAWLGRFRGVNRNLRIVDTAAGIERLDLPAHGHCAPHHEHERTRDPHTWLSPVLAVEQAGVICRTLGRLDPSHKGHYEANLEAFRNDVADLDARIRSLLDGVRSKTFMVFHPAWNYFARDYGLEMVAVEVGGQEPSASELAGFIRMARARRVGAIFAQPEFSTRAVDVLARELGCAVVLASPLAENWLDNLLYVAETFRAEAGSGEGE